MLASSWPPNPLGPSWELPWPENELETVRRTPKDTSSMNLLKTQAHQETKTQNLATLLLNGPP
jgi:hypothetical protein